jgi:hypothetical protein
MAALGINRMSSPVFPLVNPYPVSSRDPSARDVALAEAGALELPSKETYCGPREIVQAVMRDEGVGAAHNAFEGSLKESAEYKDWQRSMPYLKDVPNISTFRKGRKGHVDPWKANDEVLEVGGLLCAGQILYRGGVFRHAEVAISEGPVSTSMHPSVARWHAIEVRGQVAILRIAEDRKVKGFAYQTVGNQKHKAEFEVLLQSGLRLNQYEVFEVKGITVKAYDVYRENA